MQRRLWKKVEKVGDYGVHRIALAARKSKVTLIDLEDSLRASSGNPGCVFLGSSISKAAPSRPADCLSHVCPRKWQGHVTDGGTKR